MGFKRNMAAAAFVVLLAAPAAAQSVWTLVGSRPVSAGVDRDAIPVQDREVYSQIVLCADGGAVRLHDVSVRFSDGSSQDLGLRDKIDRGRCTDSFDLRRGRDRYVDSVAFAYDAGAGRSPARLRVMAR